MFQEIHKARIFPADLSNIKNDPASVNGLFLYRALEELRTMREFASHDYWRHPKPKYSVCCYAPF